MIQAQVALLASAKSRFEERAIELPAPQVGEAIVEIDLCTVCGSDLHSFNGRRPMSGVTVLGHEIIGRVVALPDGELHDFLGQRISEGDRISWSLCASCRECFWCKNDLPQKCQHLFKYGHAPWDKSSLATGGLGTHCQLRKGTTIIRVPDGLSDRVICPANCATATAAAAFREFGNNIHDQTIVIFGGGMLGLTAAAMASTLGARQIVVVEPHAGRQQRATQFGATHVVANNSEAKTIVDSVTDSRGADYCLELSGNNDAVLGAIHFARMGGRVALVGTVFPTESIPVSPEFLVRRCLSIVGIHNYRPIDLLTAIQFLERKHDAFPFVSLVSQVYPLAQVDQAFTHASDPSMIRVGISP